MLVGLVLCAWLFLDGLIRLASGRRWLGTRPALEGGRVRRSGLYAAGLGLGLGLEDGMVWAGDHAWLPGPAILAVAGAGVIITIASAVSFWPARRSPEPDHT